MIRLGSAILHSSRATDWAAPLSRPRLLLRCDPPDYCARLISLTGEIRTWKDPLDALAWMEHAITSQGEVGRWIGFLSYDLAQYFEQLPTRACDDLNLPLFAFMWHDPTRPREQPAGCPAEFAARDAELCSTFTRNDYLRAVTRTIDYIRDGDVFQVNLSQRFTAGLRNHPHEIWQRLIESSPAHYGAFLDFGDFQLISNSPELLLRIENRQITTRPVKGTRSRAPGMADELRTSTKDQAELNMIVDVERNDLGRICEIGTVKVTEPRAIESHPTVYHAAAEIQGTLRQEVHFVDVLRAMFPTGSITGAPKIRAMQIIDELEPVCRGPYCGAIGYLDATGRIEFNVAIRTMILKGGLAHVPVGGGIVADSDPQAEYDETLLKAKAMFDALGVAR